MRDILFIRVRPKCGHEFEAVFVGHPARNDFEELFKIVTGVKKMWRKRYCSECYMRRRNENL